MKAFKTYIPLAAMALTMALALLRNPEKGRQRLGRQTDNICH